MKIILLQDIIEYLAFFAKSFVFFAVYFLQQSS